MPKWMKKMPEVASPRETEPRHRYAAARAELEREWEKMEQERGQRDLQQHNPLVDALNPRPLSNDGLGAFISEMNRIVAQRKAKR
jgi:hypothetical protein